MGQDVAVKKGSSKKKPAFSKEILKKGFQLLCTAKAMTELYEANFKLVSKYVHATFSCNLKIMFFLTIEMIRCC